MSSHKSEVHRLDENEDYPQFRPVCDIDAHLGLGSTSTGLTCLNCGSRHPVVTDIELV